MNFLQNLLPSSDIKTAADELKKVTNCLFVCKYNLKDVRF